MLYPLKRDQTLEADVSAKRITSWEYREGLIWRYTHREAFRHFKSRHARFIRHLRLLFAELDALSREDVIYRGTNGLPTATKASQLLQRYPKRVFYEYRFAVMVSHTDPNPPPARELTSQQKKEWAAYLRDVYRPRPRMGVLLRSSWAVRRIAELR
jgi:hypothetical protein